MEAIRRCGCHVLRRKRDQTIDILLRVNAEESRVKRFGDSRTSQIFDLLSGGIYGFAVYDFDAFDFHFAGENLGEAVGGPPVQVFSATQVGDRAKRSDCDFVVQRDIDVSDFTGVFVFVSQSDEAPTMGFRYPNQNRDRAVISWMNSTPSGSPSISERRVDESVDFSKPHFESLRTSSAFESKRES